MRNIIRLYQKESLNKGQFIMLKNNGKLQRYVVLCNEGPLPNGNFSLMLTLSEKVTTNIINRTLKNEI